jgi:hypothetical protein
MRPLRSTSINAASSTSGPRDVFTKIAPAFMACSSAAPTMPRERSESP